MFFFDNYLNQKPLLHPPILVELIQMHFCTVFVTNDDTLLILNGQLQVPSIVDAPAL